MGRILWTVTAGALLASFLGYGFVAFSVTAWRRRELALQMAMGARRQEIWQQTLFEHLIAGTAASVLGLVIGLGAALLTSSVWDWPLVLEWGVGGGAMLFGTLAGALLGAAAGPNRPPLHLRSPQRRTETFGPGQASGNRSAISARRAS
ncbi:MAG: ABC transporter permease [Brevundimonas sp.]|nr:MAG: ABC transporter permease [Brevundimonas sp.]